MPKRGFFWSIPAIVCLFLSACAPPPADNAKSGKKGGGDVPVTVAKVSQRDVPVEVQVIGNVEAYTSITVRAQVGGQLIKVGFNEGDYVKKDDVLFQIDSRPYEAALQQAQASLQMNNANLLQARSNLQRDQSQQVYNKAQAARYAQLFKEGVISKDQTEQTGTTADISVHAVEADRAAIASMEAQIKATQAMIETAKVNLSYCIIKSPLDGRTGNLATKQGTIIQANSQDLVTINQVQPIYVTFNVPEAQLASIKKYMANGKLAVTAVPQDDPNGVESGFLTFLDNSVDASTGTIKLKGTFPNTQRRLWPGEFVRVTLRLTTMKDALVVPNQAIQTGQDGQFVFKVNEDKKVVTVPVVSGIRMDQDIAITGALQPNDTVVTEGQLRLAPGSRVVVREGRPGGKGGGRPAGAGPGAGGQRPGGQASPTGL